MSNRHASAHQNMYLRRSMPPRETLGTTSPSASGAAAEHDTYAFRDFRLNRSPVGERP